MTRRGGARSHSGAPRVVSPARGPAPQPLTAVWASGARHRAAPRGHCPFRAGALVPDDDGRRPARWAAAPTNVWQPAVTRSPLVEAAARARRAPISRGAAGPAAPPAERCCEGRRSPGGIASKEGWALALYKGLHRAAAPGRWDGSIERRRRRSAQPLEPAPPPPHARTPPPARPCPPPRTRLGD